MAGCAAPADTHGPLDTDRGAAGALGFGGTSGPSEISDSENTSGTMMSSRGGGGSAAGNGGTQPTEVGEGGSWTADDGGTSSEDDGGGMSAGMGAGGRSGAGAQGGGGTSSMRLNHPGILNSANDLAAIKRRVLAKTEPWASAFDRLRSSAYASLSYAAKPYAAVECGSYNQPNIGCSQMVDDGMAAYAHSLVWNATGDGRHAAKAIAIIDAWANKYQRNTDSNSRLVVAWATPWYANAAEILRYSDAGWTSGVQQRFSRLLTLWLPYVNTDDPPLNNWMQSRIEAHFAIAVFLDDPDELEKALARWKKFFPGYVLNDGLCGETCRDLGHTGLGIRSMLYAAETAWQQGVDLFSPNQARLAKLIELHGTWMLGQAAVPNDVCGGVVKAAENDDVGIRPPEGGGRMPLEILYSHLHARLHVPLPKLEQMIRRARPLGGGHWVLKWETLTHAVPL